LILKIVGIRIRIVINKQIEFSFHLMGSTTNKMHHIFFARGTAPNPAGELTTIPQIP